MYVCMCMCINAKKSLLFAIKFFEVQKFSQFFRHLSALFFFLNAAIITEEHTIAAIYYRFISAVVEEEQEEEEKSIVYADSASQLNYCPKKKSKKKILKKICKNHKPTEAL